MFDFDIGFIGAGNMGYALAQSISQSKGQLTMLAADPWRTEAKRLKWAFSTQTQSNGDVLNKCRIVFLCVKPQVFADACDGQTGRAGQVMVSVIAGLSLKSMKSQFPQVQHHIRIMTDTAVTIGEGVMAITPDPSCPSEITDEVSKLLEKCGCLEIVPERCMDGVTGMSGSGIAFVYQFIEALADGGVNSGLPRHVAAKFAAQTVLAGAKMVQQTGRHPASLKDDVTSPAGTTIAGLRAAEKAGLRSAVIEAVAAATDRSAALSSS